MKAQQVIEILCSRKGQHVLAVWERPVKTFKASGVIVTKRTSAYVRAGINFANLSSVKNAIEAGERGEVQALPSCQEWESFPFILRHKTKGTQYVRLFPPANGFDNLPKPQTEWTLNGQPSSYAQVEPHLLAEEKPDGSVPECYALTADYVKEIAGE